MENFGIRIGRRVNLRFIPLVMTGLVVAAVLVWVLGGYFGYDIHALISYFSDEPPRYVVNIAVGDRVFGVHTFGDYLLAHDYATSGSPWINSISASNNYPPLAMGFFWVLSLLPYKIGLALFLLLSILSMLYPVVAELRRQNAFEKYGVLLVPCILSVGVIAALDRGNYVALLVTPLYLFFRMIKEEKWERSVLLLALMVSLKIYPLLLLVAYLPKLKFLRMAQVVLYSLVASVASALFFHGGLIKNLKAIYHGILGYHAIGPAGLDPGNTSLFGAVSRTLVKFPSLIKEFQFVTSHQWWLGIAYFLLVLYTLLSKKVPQEIVVFLLVSVLWQVPPLSFHYVTCFLLVPIALSLRDVRVTPHEGERGSYRLLYTLTTISILATLLPIVIPIVHGSENAMRSIASFSWAVLAIAASLLSGWNLNFKKWDIHTVKRVRKWTIEKINAIAG